MSPDITLRTRDSIASLLNELSFGETEEKSPVTEAMEMNAETAGEKPVDDFAGMEVVPLTADELSTEAQTSSAVKFDFQAHQRKADVQTNYQARPAARPWKMFLNALAGKVPVFVETKTAAENEAALVSARMTKPAMWKWSLFLDNLAGRAAVAKVVEVNASPEIRWKSMAVRSPGLTIAELITQIDA